MHGPTIPAALPTLEAGMAVLQRAGFGDQTAFAYALLLNKAMLTVSISDDRLEHEGDGPRDHASMMAEFEQMPTAPAAVRAMGRELMRPFAEGSETAARIREAYYRFAIDTTIDGIAATLARDTH